MVKSYGYRYLCVYPYRLSLCAIIVFAAIVGAIAGSEAAGGAASGLSMDAVPVRYLVAAGLAFAYLLFCVETVRNHRYAQRAQEAMWASGAPADMAGAGGGAVGGSDGVLIAFASQTGFAEQLALQTAQSMRLGGAAVSVLPLGRVDADQLSSHGRVLFIVSTTGEGDAPDSAAGFARDMMQPGRFSDVSTDISTDVGGDFNVDADAGLAGQSPALRNLRFGILALGDRSYAHYCAFGHALQNWLLRHHAQPLFDMLEVDNGDEGALRHWQYHLGVLSGATETADWTSPTYGRWRLTERTLLNPGSVGGPAFHLSLTSPDTAALAWQAGDIAEIGPRNAPADVHYFLRAIQLYDAPGDLIEALETRLLPHEEYDEPAIASLRGLSPMQLLDRMPRLPHRQYSIASIPQHGSLDLLVRRVVHDSGRSGIGSAWLTQHAEVGAEIALRVRGNRHFHPPEDDIPMILIGNGTGLAGLRSHMQARAHAGRHRNWLIFGERSRATDYLHRAEIDAWTTEGVLQRVDLAFSRDQSQRVYVQDKLRESAADLLQWVEQGAAIYVCGSLLGMASGVAHALQDILGEDRMIALAEAGRYRRDVY
jgi:sulfite reductase (NADPH) flavoprotein alpha-component